MSWPSPPSPNTPIGRWCASLLAEAKARSITSVLGGNLKTSPAGTRLVIDRNFSGGGSPGLTVQLFQVSYDPYQASNGDLIQHDYVTAKKATFNKDGTISTSGSDILIAKAMHMRTRPGPLFVPHPPYVPDFPPYATDPGKDKYSLLYAVQNPTGNSGVLIPSADGISTEWAQWVEISDRNWAYIKNVCIDGNPALQNFVASNPYAP